MLFKPTLDIPESVYREYAAQGDVDAAISTRLVTCIHHTSKKPIYIDDLTRKQFEKLLGRNFSTAEALLAAVRTLMTVKVADIEVPLQPTLLQRLRTRCFGQTFDQFLTERIVRELEEYTMMG